MTCFSRTAWCSAGLASLLLAAACAPQEQQQGTLGDGSFAYACVSTADPECPDDLSDTPTAFPTLALGGTFSLTYTANDGTSAVVSPASPDFFVAEGQTFTAIRTGTPGFIAQTPSRQIIDFTEVTVEEVQSVHVTDTTDSFGDTSMHTYTGTAIGTLDEPLAGVVLYDWTTSDPSVLDFQGGQDLPSNSIVAVYRKHGTATLTAKTGNAAGSINVNVSGGE
jgi:hypothetical protein